MQNDMFVIDISKKTPRNFIKFEFRERMQLFLKIRPISEAIMYCQSFGPFKKISGSLICGSIGDPSDLTTFLAFLDELKIINFFLIFSSTRYNVCIEEEI